MKKSRNTFFAIPDAAAQQQAFHHVAERLDDGGRFVVEAFVPPEPEPGGSPRRSGVVGVRSLSADRVVLSVDTTDPGAQRSEGQYVEFTEAGGFGG